MGNMALRKDHVIEKRNVLNEMRATQLNLVELRFLLVYLSKINARDPGTRTVRFPLADFVKIMEIQKVNISAMKATANRLLSHVVNIPDVETGGFTAFQLFKECRVNKEPGGDWYVEIDAHDKALPLMFDFKKDYFKYELWNALRLNSPQQVRMYEILKQYEHKGGRTLTLEELRALLGIEKTAYPVYADFRKQILDKYQRLLKDTTDIYYTYEPIGKGQGGKVVSISFKIFKNEDFVDQLTLAEFIDLQAAVDDTDAIGEAMFDQEEIVEPGETPFKVYRDETGKRISRAEHGYIFLTEAFDGDLNKDQVEVLYRIALPYIEHYNPGIKYDELLLKMYDYFQLKYAEVKAQKKQVRSKFGLLKFFVDNDAKKVSRATQAK